MAIPSGVALTPTALAQVAAVLVVARLLGVVAERARLTAVVGELATGFVLGAAVLGSVAPGAHTALFGAGVAPLLRAVAGLGLLAVLVVAGLEVSPAAFGARLRSTAVVAGVALLTPFTLAFGLAWLLPAAFVPAAGRLPFALFFACALSVSAIPVVVRVLDALGALSSTVGQTALAAAMLTDVVVWLLIGALLAATRGEGAVGRSVALSLAGLAGFVLVLAVVGPRLARLAVRGPPRRQVLGLAVLATVAVALAEVLGVEAGVGAFAAGIVVAVADVLSERAEEAVRVGTTGLVAPVFFGAAGLQADLGALASPTVLALLAVTLVVATVGKFAGGYAGARLVGLSPRSAVGVGAALNARGAMEIVLATVGLAAGLLSPALYAVVLAVAVLTSAMAPPVIRWSVAGD